jgi:hypothetical protein
MKCGVARLAFSRVEPFFIPLYSLSHAIPFIADTIHSSFDKFFVDCKLFRIEQALLHLIIVPNFRFIILQSFRLCAFQRLAHFIQYMSLLTVKEVGGAKL